VRLARLVKSKRAFSYLCPVNAVLMYFILAAPNAEAPKIDSWSGTLKQIWRLKLGQRTSFASYCACAASAKLM